MPVLLLALFPILLLHRPRYAFVAIGLAIVFMYRQRVSKLSGGSGKYEYE